jgi:acetyltransferase-like isoleucine patch superfamily enzyme
MKNVSLIGNDFFVGENVIFSGKVKIGKGAQIWHNCVIGFSGKFGQPPSESLSIDDEITSIGAGTTINPFSVIFRGAKIGQRVEIQENSRIGHKSIVGNGTKIVYGAKIYDNVTIGTRSIIAGFCCNGSRIGNETTMMGHLLHKYPSHAIDVWDDEEADDEPSPIIEDNVVVGYNSLIIGGITIGRNSYIAAGSIICNNVPPNTKVIMSRALKSSMR